MIKKLILTCLFIPFLFHLKAQELCVSSLFNTFEGGNVYLSLKGGTRFTTQHLPQTYFSINSQVLVSEYVGLNYSFGIGKNYGHIPFFGAGFWGSLAADIASDDDALCVILLLALLPEGFTFYIPLKENLKFSPYVNFMGSERLKGEYGDYTNTFRGAYTFGTQIMYDSNGTIISPYIEFSGLYMVPVNGLRLGVSLGRIF